MITANEPLQITWSMTPKKTIDYLSKFTYKPDHDVYCTTNLHGTEVYIKITKPVTNVLNGDKTYLGTGWRFNISKSTNYKDLDAYFLFVALSQEVHETYEWARKLNEPQLVNPHPVGNAATELELKRITYLVKSALNYQTSKEILCSKVSYDGKV